MDKIFVIASVSVLSFVLSACQMSHKPPTTTKVCAKLRRQYADNRNKNSAGSGWNVHSQRQRLQKLMREHNC